MSIQHISNEGPIVVGLETSPASREAARFAVAEAASHGHRLVVVSALGYPEEWTEQRLLADDKVANQKDRVVAELRDYLADELAAHPDVQVEYRISPGPPPEALMAASDGAALVVVGTRGRGALTSLLLGSTSRRAAQTVRCPLAIIPATMGA